MSHVRHDDRVPQCSVSSAFSQLSSPAMVILQFTNPTDYDVRVEAGGMVRYLSPKNEKSVDGCKFPDGNYEQFRMWYVDSTGYNQLGGVKIYTVKTDPGVDLYVWTVQDNSGWLWYDFEVSWRSYARSKLQASAHAEPDRKKRQRQVRAGTC